MEEVVLYVSQELDKLNLKYELHRFESGAVMIDIWVRHKFYCIQLYENYIGLSLVTEDSGFSTIPDISYESISEFQHDFQQILSFARQ